MLEEHIQNEEELISLFISDKDNVEEWNRTNIKESYFDSQHNIILAAIKYAHNLDVSLTLKNFKSFLELYKKFTPQEIVVQIQIYNRCAMRVVKKDDMPTLFEKVKAAYINRVTTKSLNELRKDREKIGDLAANRQLIDKLRALESDAIESKSSLIEIHSEKDNFMKALMERRKNPNIRLTCNLPEIDGTMNVGFKPGHLTMFSADVGCYKTGIMINVALNLFRHSLNPNILYIPLEMPKEEILQKIVSRETRVPFSLIEHSDLLTEDQIKLVAEAWDKWENIEHRFSILEMGERSKVSIIRREIEKRISYFQPKVVFVDYADNLVPDYSRGSRNDLELNDMLEDLRRMGKALGFGVVSAAQLSRDALKKVMEQKEGKQQLGSTDLKGGQVMTATSDTVYAQLRNPALPNEELFFFCIKARHGKNMFNNGLNKTILKVTPDIGLIESPVVLGWNNGVCNERITDLVVQEVNEEPF